MEMEKDEKAQKIISAATEVFMRFGIKSVNMDDIARHLGVSKKTLYKYVSDKNDLVTKAFDMHCSLEDNAISTIQALGLNAIDEMFEVQRMVITMVKDLHPSVLYDMQKYHPEQMKRMEESRHQTISDTMVRNMEKGMKEGLYRDDLKPDIVAALYVSAIETFFRKVAFDETEYSFQDLYLELFRLHIRGIASEKGIQYLIEKVRQEQNTNAK
jgi:AcrR family transcriptional regulator